MTTSEPDLQCQPRPRLFRLSVRVLMILPVVVVLASWLYMQSVRLSIGPIWTNPKTLRFARIHGLYWESAHDLLVQVRWHTPEFEQAFLHLGQRR